MIDPIPALGNEAGPQTERRSLAEKTLAYLTEGRAPAVKTALVCWLLSLLLYSPPFFMWSWDHFLHRSRAHDVLALAADPLSRDLLEPITAYRLTVPLIAHVLHLPPLATLLLPYLGNILFLALVFLALRRRASPASAFLGTATVALSFAVMWCNWQPGFVDSISNALTASMLLSTFPPWVFAATFLGTLNDERMVLALPFVFLWHFPLKPGTKWIAAPTLIWCAAISSAVCTYLLVRHGLTVGWVGSGIFRPNVYAEMSAKAESFQPFLGSWTAWSFNAFQSFRWAWVFPILFAVARWVGGYRTEALIYMGALALGTLASAIVQDVGRSIGFMFAAWVLALAGTEPARGDASRILKLVVVALCFTPVLYSIQRLELMWMRPMPFVVARCLTQP